MSDQDTKNGKSFKLPLFVAALFLANLSIYTTNYFQNIVLLDVSKTFKVTVGTMSQLSTVSYLTGIIIGLAMGFLAVRFKHKSLLLLGIAELRRGNFSLLFRTEFCHSTVFPCFRRNRKRYG